MKIILEPIQKRAPPIPSIPIKCDRCKAIFVPDGGDTYEVGYDHINHMRLSQTHEEKRTRWTRTQYNLCYTYSIGCPGCGERATIYGDVFDVGVKAINLDPTC